MATYTLVCLLCAAWCLVGYLLASTRAIRRERGSRTPRAFTLTSRPIGTTTAPSTAAGCSSIVTLGDPLAGQVWPVTLAEPNRPNAPTGYGSFEGGNRGNGLLPYAGCDD